MNSDSVSNKTDATHIRPASSSDLAAIIALDQEVTGLAKRKYWKEMFKRYGARRRSPQFFFVAEDDGRIDGLAVGEVRAWEFGEPPCGWVVAIQVHPRTRLKGVATLLYQALGDAFRRAGVTKIRTLMARDNHLILSFFRSQGMMAGPFIELEMTLD